MPAAVIEKFTNLLTEDEKLIAQARIHWIVFAPPALYAIIALLVALFFHPLVGGVIIFLSLYPLYTASIHYWMTYLFLTNKKVLSRNGFLTRDWIRMNFSKIENAYLEEPLLGRYIGYSTVIVTGVGTGNITVNYVRDGDKFIKLLEKQLTEKQGL